MGIFGGTSKGVQWPLQVTFEGTEGRHNLGCGPKWPDIFNSNEKHLKVFTKFQKWDHTQHNSSQGVKEMRFMPLVFTLILLSFKHNLHFRLSHLFDT
jgi:hypothetical protein